METEEQEWIEAPDGWGPEDSDGRQDDDNGGGLLDLFGNDDPSEFFTFHIKINKSTTKTIRLDGFKLDSNETDRSTGVTLWQAAPRLAEYLQDHTVMCEGKSVLELGAGLGLCGITAYYLGAKSVIMTDGDTNTLQQLRENVRQNCSVGDATKTDYAIDCRQLFWGSPHMEKFLEHHGKYDTILGADVIYNLNMIQPLLDTVACFLKPNGRFVLSRYNKWGNVDDEVIIEAAKIRSLGCTKHSEGIFIFHWNEGNGDNSAEN